ncbi:MAG: CBS domain-containing protein [Kiritimatiellae bacterium]|nr:CBS domain-containing protein [Kiritimatiellia bacterium]
MKMHTPVGQLLKKKGGEVLTIAQDVTVYDAVKTMDEKGMGSLLILDDQGRLAGIFTERDCLRKVVLAGLQPESVQVGQVMTTKVIYVTPETTVDECMALVTEKRFRHLPVIDSKEKILGVISSGDLVKFVASEKAFLIENLEKYIQGSF